MPLTSPALAGRFFTTSAAWQGTKRKQSGEGARGGGAGQRRKEGLFVLAKCWAIIYLTKDLYPEYVFESFQRRRKQTTQYFKVAKDLKIY